MTETHTYPDGSQRVGCPPFPALSPKEESEMLLRGGIVDFADKHAELIRNAVPLAQPEAPRRGRPPKAKAE